MLSHCETAREGSLEGKNFPPEPSGIRRVSRHVKIAENFDSEQMTANHPERVTSNLWTLVRSDVVGTFVTDDI